MESCNQMRPPLIINWISLCRSRYPCSTAVHPHCSLTSAFSLHDTTLTRTVLRKIHEYCELFMIIRHLSIQSHDSLGAAVFKLMINSACCIQTQLIVFMPNAAEHMPQKSWPSLWIQTVFIDLYKDFFCESGLLENEPTVPAEQAHTTRRQ